MYMYLIQQSFSAFIEIYPKVNEIRRNIIEILFENIAIQ